MLTLAAVVGPLPLYWLLWNNSGFVPRLAFVATWRATLQSLHVWFAYLNTSVPPPPGIFMLPDRGLRSPATRSLFAVVTLASVTSGVMFLGVTNDPGAALVFPQAVARLLFGIEPDALEFMSWQMFVAVIVSALLPLVVALVVYWFLIGSVLARYWLALEAPRGYARSSTKSAWAISVNRMLNSRDHKEREHVLLGRSLFGDYPVLLHKSLLYQHAHLVGDSGSRKTSLGIAPLIAQLIAARDCSVVVLDLKGDRPLFETTRLEAEAAGADFRWFALETGLSSHVFNPLEQSHFDRLTPNQKTQLILEGLSLNYGDAYGRGFYSAMNEVVLLKLMRFYSVRSFVGLHALLADKSAYVAAGGSVDDWKKAQHVTALVDRLASIHALNVTADDLRDRPQALNATIDMGRLLSQPQVVYFNLCSPIEPIGSPAVAKLAMYSLFAAAAHRTREQRQRVYVVVDEFQQLVSESVRLVFEQARSSNVHFIVAHQNVEQLDRKGIDVRDTISSCTAFKQYFRASDPKTIKLLEEMSGEGMFESLTWNQTRQPLMRFDDDKSFSPTEATAGIYQVTETPGHRLERNTIMDISAAPNTSFVSFTEGSHFTQFGSYVTPIVSDYHISFKQYETRGKAAWPPANDETVVIPQVAAPAASSGRPNSVTDLDEQIGALDQKLASEESAKRFPKRD